MYEFEFTLNDEDYLEFHKYQLNHSELRNQLIIGWLAIFVAFALLSVILNMIMDISVLAIIFCVIYAGCWIFVAKPSLLVSKRKLLIKITEQYGNPPYCKNNLIRFDENFIIEITDDVEAEFEYANIEKIDAGNKAIYIRNSPTGAFIIPLSVFETKPQRAEFMGFIKGKTNLH